MTGELTAGWEAILPLEVRGPTGVSVQMDCVMDTGFTEFLTLPAGVIASLGLPYQATVRILMADGRPVEANAFGAVAVWDGEERTINVQGSGEPLVGMAMLHGA